VSLAGDLAWAVAEDIAFGDGLRPDDGQLLTQIIGDYLPDAARSVAVTLRPFVASGDYPTDRRSLLELADQVEREAQP
jgi:hypothetical protein